MSGFVINLLKFLVQNREWVADQEAHIILADGFLRKPDLTFVNPERIILWAGTILGRPSTFTVGLSAKYPILFSTSNYLSISKEIP